MLSVLTVAVVIALEALAMIPPSMAVHIEVIPAAVLPVKLSVVVPDGKHTSGPAFGSGIVVLAFVVMTTALLLLAQAFLIVQVNV